MTTEANPSQTPPAAAPAPTIDPAAIAAKAVEAATEAATKIAEQKATEFANKRIGEAVRVLQGKPEEDPKRKFLETLVDDPTRVLRTAVDVAKKEMHEELSAQEAVKATQRNVILPVIDEYPELKSEAKLDFVEARAIKYQRSGMDYAAALKKGTEDAVKEFNLKSVSEAQREGSYRYPGLPGGGGLSPGAPRFDDAKSQQSFLDGMKAKQAAQRSKR